MVRTILRALRAVMRALARVASLPGRGLGGLLGGGGYEYIEDDDGSPDPEAPEKTVDNSKSIHAAYLETLARQTIARCVLEYAANAQVDLVRQPLAPLVPRCVKEWLPGLSLSELKMLTDAGADAIGSHITRGPYIVGLFRVMRLPPVLLERPGLSSAADEKLMWETWGELSPSRVESFRH